MNDVTGTHLGVKVEVNSNTILMAVGFVSTLIGMAMTWSSSQNDIRDNARRLDDHDSVFKTVIARLDIVDKRDADMRDLTFRIGALEKGLEAADLRTSRVVESYGNKFTELSSQMGTMITQQALINQAMQRLEAQGKGAMLEVPNPELADRVK